MSIFLSPSLTSNSTAVSALRGQLPSHPALLPFVPRRNMVQRKDVQGRIYHFKNKEVCENLGITGPDIPDIIHDLMFLAPDIVPGKKHHITPHAFSQEDYIPISPTPKKPYPIQLRLRSHFVWSRGSLVPAYPSLGPSSYLKIDEWYEVPIQMLQQATDVNKNEFVVFAKGQGGVAQLRDWVRRRDQARALELVEAAKGGEDEEAAGFEQPSAEKVSKEGVGPPDLLVGFCYTTITSTIITITTYAALLGIIQSSTVTATSTTIATSVKPITTLVFTSTDSGGTTVTVTDTSTAGADFSSSSRGTAISTSSATVTSLFIPSASSTATDNQSSSNSALSPGAKAGIAIGVIVLFLLGLFALWRITLTRRKRQAPPEEGNRSPPPNTHELTNANRHELITKHNVPEMDEQNQGKGVSILKKSIITNAEREHVIVHELAPEQGRNIVSFGDEEDTSERLFASAQELESLDPRVSPSLGGEVPQPSVPIERGDISTAENEDEEQKLKILKDRIDRIRDEKERLERIQELKDLEEQTKREILEVQCRKLGS
ncbi:uncharacterized protein PAC_19089 [Phialocephala subalpina]|uniref:Uncharacterized protein n=1 Tax=Phialocephala subalpina TaxID=576137 RepID=A0A1L7XW25_9HELO|nr:uncharacterized protein PAC_19089 [Phialocephala subalpina]